MAATLTVLRDTQRPEDWWCPTPTGREIEGLCKKCLIERQLGLLIGHSGSGKTAALKSFCEKNEQAIYFRLPSADLKPREMLHALVHAAGAYVNEVTPPSAYALLEVLIKHANGYRPLLIVADEGQQAFHYGRDRGRVIHTLRDIFDAGKPHIGIVLCGNQELSRELSRSPTSTNSYFSHFTGRVGTTLVLDNKCPTPADIEALADHHSLKAAAKQLFARVVKDHKLHVAHSVIEVARRNASSPELDLKDLRDAMVTLGLNAGR
jgi:DNA transposition AAA+ family ATPase